MWRRRTLSVPVGARRNAIPQQEILVGDRRNAIPQQQILLTSAPERYDYFGQSVAISGDFLVVGAPYRATTPTTMYAGAAWVFVRTGTDWGQQQMIQATTPTVMANFGISVAISGDYLVVGAYGYAGAAGLTTNAGAAYVFMRTGTKWAQQEMLLQPAAVKFDYFGQSVAISGDYLVVGAGGRDAGAHNAGAAYVYFRSGIKWTLQQMIQARTPVDDNFFGQSVAISGDYLVAGAPHNPAIPSRGAAYVFERSYWGAGWSNWTEQGMVQATVPVDGDKFGICVAISGDFLVVGAPHNIDGYIEAGAAHIFMRSETGWTEQEQIQATVPVVADQFGFSVSIFGDYLSVGAPNHTEVGAAYVFRRAATKWPRHQTIQANAPVLNDHFGWSVAISGQTGDYLVAGAPHHDYLVAGAGNSIPYAGAVFAFSPAKSSNSIAPTPAAFAKSLAPTPAASHVTPAPSLAPSSPTSSASDSFPVLAVCLGAGAFVILLLCLCCLLYFCCYRKRTRPNEDLEEELLGAAGSGQEYDQDQATKNWFKGKPTNKASDAEIGNWFRGQPAASATVTVSL